MNTIVVDELHQPPIEDQRMEICERKGIGHPDSICDSIMDRVSVALSHEYLKKFGAIMHYNIDKGLLVAGETEERFGGGIVKKPMVLVFGDRATFTVGNDTLDIEKIAINTAKEWLKKNLRFVDPDQHVKYQVELKKGTEALTDIFKRKGKFLGANDTSAAVGYAPLTMTERLVLDTEQFLNSKDFKKRFAETGEDIKVMGLRTDNKIDITIAMAFVDRFFQNEGDYFRKKNEILQEINRFVKSEADKRSVAVSLNTADRQGRGIGGVYVTVLGTSADGADGGQVGRGNRVIGIIPLKRPAGAEAAAGKNPINHVGKIYSLLSFKIANRICEEVPQAKEVYVWLLSQIGQPINEPKIASAQLALKRGTSLKDVQKNVKGIIQDELEKMNEFVDELIQGKHSVC